ncbi:MAG: TfoX/Sxy family protein [Rubrivivax sp.]|nr:TfoX/Sxy family protein [Rubrivivax sp.]
MDLPPFVEHCLELLSPLGAVHARRMFGGFGLYADGLFVALIAAERLYLKADATTRAHFSAAGCTPFVYNGDGKSVTLAYWTVPPEALESPAQMQAWARLALQAALAARAAKALKPARTRVAPAGAAAPRPRPRPAAKARRG